jgi:hypothetical protein
MLCTPSISAHAATSCAPSVCLFPALRHAPYVRRLLRTQPLGLYANLVFWISFVARQASSRPRSVPPRLYKRSNRNISTRYSSHHALLPVHSHRQLIHRRHPSPALPSKRHCVNSVLPDARARVDSPMPQHPEPARHGEIHSLLTASTERETPTALSRTSHRHTPEIPPCTPSNAVTGALVLASTAHPAHPARTQQTAVVNSTPKPPMQHLGPPPSLAWLAKPLGMGSLKAPHPHSPASAGPSWMRPPLRGPTQIKVTAPQETRTVPWSGAQVRK